MNTITKVYPSAQHVAVNDAANGLQWAAADVCEREVTAAEADKLVAEFRLLGHADWRLPTRKELLTLVDDTRHDPACDVEVFGLKSACYWTSTPAAWSPRARWIVNFSSGYSHYSDVGSRCRVRAVRSWSPSSAGQ